MTEMNITGEVVGMVNPSMSTHHKGGALDADVSAADVELAAMAARPSNVRVIVVAVFAAISLACTVNAAASPTWATQGIFLSGSSQIGLFERCVVSTSTATTSDEYEPCWTEGDVNPKFVPPYELSTCTKWTQVDDEPLKSTYKADNEYVRRTARLSRAGAPRMVVRAKRPLSPLPTPRLLTLCILICTPLRHTCSPATYECYQSDPDAATLPPTAAPTNTAGSEGAQNDYASAQTENTKDKKGPVIIGLGFCAGFAVASNVAHFVAFVIAIAVVVVSFLHNWCVLGRL